MDKTKMTHINTIRNLTISKVRRLTKEYLRINPKALQPISLLQERFNK